MLLIAAAFKIQGKAQLLLIEAAFEIQGKAQLLLISAAFEIQGKANLLLTETLLWSGDLNHFDKSAVPTFLVTLSINLSHFPFF